MEKKYIYHIAQSLLAAAVLVLSLTSCESLEQGNLSELAENNLPQSDADAKALINAVYASDIELATTYMYLIDLTTETTVSGENPNGGGGMLGLLSWDGTNSYLVRLWQAYRRSQVLACLLSELCCAAMGTSACYHNHRSRNQCRA